MPHLRCSDSIGSAFYKYTAPMALRNRPQVRFQPEQPILLWKAGRYKLAARVSKTGSASPRSEHCADAFRHFFKTATKGNHMKYPIRRQSQLLFRRSYKPNRMIRIRPAVKLNHGFRPWRARRGATNERQELEALPEQEPSRCSKVEPPADNRKTQEHYLPGRPAFALRATARRAGFLLSHFCMAL
jgi:hypothetical protein